MAYSPIAFTAVNYRDYKNNWIKAYEPGTTTAKAMVTDSTLATTIIKAEININGFIISAGDALITPHIDGAYDLWLFPTEADADANDTSEALRLADNITGVGGEAVASNAKYNPATIQDAIDSTEWDGAGGEVFRAQGYHASGIGAGTWKTIIAGTTANVDQPNGFDIVQFVGVPNLAAKLIRSESKEDPRKWGAKFDDSTDIGPVLNYMLSVGVTIDIPTDKGVINTQVNILEESCVVFNGTRLRTTNTTLTMFKALSVDGWALLGSAWLTGTAPASPSSQKLLSIIGCENYVVENITTYRSQGHGFFIGTDGVITSNNRAQHGRINNSLALECQTGWEFEDGTSAEYTVLSGCSALLNVTGVKNGAGNTNWSGGNIVDNSVGVDLYGGSNDNHGIFSGVNINHNTTTLNATDVWNGYTFSGCHFYGSSVDGRINLTNCKQFNFDGGTLACTVKVDKGDGDGAHDGAANAAVLTDTTATWTVDGFKGQIITNITDGSEGIVISNTATTITATLSGGTDNDWDVGDKYHFERLNVFRDSFMNVPAWCGFSGTDLDSVDSSGHKSNNGLEAQFTIKRSPTRVVDDMGFQNGWSDAAGMMPLNYRVDENNIMHINGAVSGGTAAFATKLVSLNSNLKGRNLAPSQTMEFILKEGASATNAPAYVQIDTAGDILWLSGGNTEVCLNISYPLNV